eukprot:4584416-Amphidinium_carterae.1
MDGVPCKIVVVLPRRLTTPLSDEIASVFDLRVAGRQCRGACWPGALHGAEFARCSLAVNS